jgi:hypothetical protein
MPNHLHSPGASPRELEVLKLGVLFDKHFFNGVPTKVHFIPDSTMVGTWVDEQGGANLNIGLDRIQFMNSDQLAFLVAHEYGHLVLKHPAKTLEIQKQYGISSTLDEFMLPFDAKRDYSKLMRDMELQADLFGTKLVMGLGRDPVSGSSFLLGETKSMQHPEGTLRVAKIKSSQDSLVAEDFSKTLSDLGIQLGDAEVLAALAPNGQARFEANDSTVKAMVEEQPSHATHEGYAGQALYGFEVSVMLTVAILACAAPWWWRKTSVG